MQFDYTPNGHKLRCRLGSPPGTAERQFGIRDLGSKLPHGVGRPRDHIFLALYGMVNSFG